MADLTADVVFQDMNDEEVEHSSDDESSSDPPGASQDGDLSLTNSSAVPHAVPAKLLGTGTRIATIVDLSDLDDPEPPTRHPTTGGKGLHPSQWAGSTVPPRPTYGGKSPKITAPKPVEPQEG